MSKKTLSIEIRKELKKLNDRIDRKIIRGLQFQKEARRHKELLVTLRHVDDELHIGTRVTKHTFRRVKSPVRRSLERGVVSRVFGLRLA